MRPLQDNNSYNRSVLVDATGIVAADAVGGMLDVTRGKNGVTGLEWVQVTNFDATNFLILRPDDAAAATGDDIGTIVWPKTTSSPLKGPWKTLRLGAVQPNLTPVAAPLMASILGHY